MHITIQLKISGDKYHRRAKLPGTQYVNVMNSHQIF